VEDIGHVPKNESCELADTLSIAFLKDHSYLNALPAFKQLMYAKHCFRECSVRTHDLVMDPGYFGVDWNSPYNVWVPNGRHGSREPALG